ncbi:hypothetical protein ISP17_13575 [Dyella ginsengisoli]|uniref:Antitoxin VbhA domain-containing protein n=1 Tax=Dyella ginsengisoli TaxID=363848 RepID=A0ABW8JY20_9GAMM
MYEAATQPASAAGKVFAQMAHIAAHEVLTLRELRQRAVNDGVHSLGELNQLLDAMIAERSRFIGGGYPDVTGDAYEAADLERIARGAIHA